MILVSHHPFVTSPVSPGRWCLPQKKMIEIGSGRQGTTSFTTRTHRKRQPIAATPDDLCETGQNVKAPSAFVPKVAETGCNERKMVFFDRGRVGYQLTGCADAFRRGAANQKVDRMKSDALISLEPQAHSFLPAMASLLFLAVSRTS